MTAPWPWSTSWRRHLDHQEVRSSATFLIFLVVIVAAVYFLFLRPQQQKARASSETMSEVDVGDEVLTVGGIVGRMVEMDDDHFTIVTGEHNEEGSHRGHPDADRHGPKRHPAQDRARVRARRRRASEPGPRPSPTTSDPDDPRTRHPDDEDENGGRAGGGQGGS